MIDDASNQFSKFKTMNWVEITDESRGTYNVNSQIKFKTTMLKSSLFDYSDAYILVRSLLSLITLLLQMPIQIILIRKVIFKSCAPFTNCVSKINNIQVDNAKDIDIVIPMYNLIKYTDNY